LGPPRPGNDTGLEEEAVVRAGEGMIQIDRQTAPLHGLAHRGAPVQIVAAVIPYSHGVNVATGLMASGAGSFDDGDRARLRPVQSP
jgi:hypothetical protein